MGIKPSQQLISIGAILMLAWLLRLPGLHNDSFWFNEVLSFKRSTQASLSAGYDLIRQGVHPPLYPLGVLYPWLQFGQNEFFQRFPSVVFGMLSISLTYVLGRLAFSPKIGLLGAFLLTISPLHVYYAREGRMYTVLGFFALLWLCSLLMALRRPYHNRYWLGYTIFGALSLYTHYYAGLTLFVSAGFVTLYMWRNFERPLFIKWLGANLGLALFFVPWLPALWGQLGNIPDSYLSHVPVTEWLQMPAQFFLRSEVLSGLLKWLGAGLAYGLVVSGLLALFWTRPRRTKALMVALYLTSLIFGTFFIAFLISFYKPITFIRYFLGVVPLVCLLVAVGVAHLPVPRLGSILAAGLIALSFYSSYQVTTSSWRSDYRGVMAHIEQHARPEDIILFLAPEDDPFWTMAFDYYAQGRTPVARVFDEKRDEAEMRSTLTTLPPHEGVWVVQNSRVASLEEAYPAHRLTFHHIFHAEMPVRWATVEVAYLEFVGTP